MKILRGETKREKRGGFRMPWAAVACVLAGGGLLVGLADDCGGRMPHFLYRSCTAYLLVLLAATVMAVRQRKEIIAGWERVSGLLVWPLWCVGSTLVSMSGIGFFVGYLTLAASIVLFGVIRERRAVKVCFGVVSAALTLAVLVLYMTAIVNEWEAGVFRPWL